MSELQKMVRVTWGVRVRLARSERVALVLASGPDQRMQPPSRVALAFIADRLARERRAHAVRSLAQSPGLGDGPMGPSPSVIYSIYIYTHTMSIFSAYVKRPL
jgi:hypothetical protein